MCVDGTGDPPASAALIVRREGDPDMSSEFARPRMTRRPKSFAGLARGSGP